MYLTNIFCQFHNIFNIQISIDNNQNKYIIAIDTGTTSTRIILFDLEGKSIVKVQRNHNLITFQDKPRFVEQNAEEIYFNLRLLLTDLQTQMQKLNISEQQIISCGITNQRETIVFWDKYTGVTLRNSIVWQDVRTLDQLEDIKKEAENKNINIEQISGLPISTFFSSTKIKWVIENDETIQQAIKEKRLFIGTMDSFLIYKLTCSQKHMTDITNAQRTQLVDIKTLKYSQELCDLFKIPIECLPEIHSSTYDYGQIQIQPFKGIHITGVAGDQQASLFGHQSLGQNTCKITLGTGAFMLQNIGENLKYAKKGFLTTIAYQLENQNVKYAHEGSISCCGATIEWLVKNNFVSSLQDFDNLIIQFYQQQKCYNKPETQVVFIPAFQGLFSPYWRPEIRAQISNLSQSTTRSEICYAAVEGIIMQINDMLNYLGDMKPKSISIDGGLLNCPQFSCLLSELCQIQVNQKEEKEITALGVAMLSSLGSKIFENEDLMRKSFKQKIQKFNFSDSEIFREKVQNKWKKQINFLINQK